MIGEPDAADDDWELGKNMGKYYEIIGRGSDLRSAILNAQSDAPPARR